MLECDPIAQLVRRAIGFDVESIGRGAFVSTTRAALDCTQDCEPCAARLHLSPQILEALIEQLVVPETWFFRDGEPFACLAHMLRQMPRERRPFRILSVPCSTGEEPYSIAMALIDAGFDPASFSIDAVDISQRALAAAKVGRYGSASFRGGRRDRHFIADSERFAVKEPVKQAVNFRRENACTTEFLAGETPYDVIFCRNLLVYLAPEARVILLQHLRRLLAPDGILFAGHAELAVVLAAGFDAVPHPGAFACRPGQRAGAAKPAKKAKSHAARKSAEIAGAKEELARARALADRGELSKSSDLCDRILEKERDQVEAHFLKGLIELVGGRTESAEQWLRKTLYLEPGHYEALLHMSALAESRGETEQGAVFMERARRSARRQESERG